MLEETSAGTAARRRSCLAHLSSRHRFKRSQLGATLRWVWRYRVHCLLCFILGAFRALTGAACCCAAGARGDLLCRCATSAAAGSSHPWCCRRLIFCSGNPLLLFFAPELFQTLGTSQNYSLLSAVIQACFKVGAPARAAVRGRPTVGGRGAAVPQCPPARAASLPCPATHATPPLQLLGNVLCMLLVDRVGRKKLQVFGGLGQFACQLAATLITAIQFDGTAITGARLVRHSAHAVRVQPAGRITAPAAPHSPRRPRLRSAAADAEAWSLTAVLCLFEVFFELSICTLSWVIATEICPLEIRSIGAGFHGERGRRLHLLLLVLLLPVLLHAGHGRSRPALAFTRPPLLLSALPAPAVMGDLCLQIFFSQLTLTLMASRPRRGRACRPRGHAS